MSRVPEKAAVIPYALCISKAVFLENVNGMHKIDGRNKNRVLGHPTINGHI